MSRASLALRAAASFVALLATSCGAAPAAVDPGPPAPVVEHVRHQEILTPLPLRVSLPRSAGAEHVVVLVRTWGSRGWKAVELVRAGQTWSGEVSCREVSTVTGDTRYFFVVLDDDGELVGGSGTADFPHVATIVGKLAGGPQALPGGRVPLRCHDPADCPPDFPGCPAYAVRRRACRADDDCAGDRCAWDGYCGAPSVDVAAAPAASEQEELDLAIRAVSQRYRKGARSSRAAAR